MSSGWIGAKHSFWNPYKGGGKWRYRVVPLQDGRPMPGARPVSRTLEVTEKGPREPGKLSKLKAGIKEAQEAVKELAGLEREAERKAAEQASDPSKRPSKDT